MSRKKSTPYAEKFKRSSAQLAFESEQSIKNTAKESKKRSLFKYGRHWV